MNDFLIIASGAGLRDGLNPCIFMTCACFIVYRSWLAAGSLRIGWFCSVFVLIYVLCGLMFNFGPGQILVDQKNFIFAAKIVYALLSVLAFIVGLSLFKDWIFIRRGQPAVDLIDKKVKPWGTKGFKAYMITFVAAIVLSSLASLCPINNYITLLGGVAILKSQWYIALPILSCYAVTNMWALWFVWAFVDIKNLRASLYKIICAAVFFTATACVVLIFN